MNATGQGFNSVAAIEGQPDGRTNPMVNAGAIAATSLSPGDTVAEKWRFIRDGLSRFAGRELSLNEEVYASASQTNFRNRSIAADAGEPGPDLLRPARGAGPVHPAVLARRQRPRPGGDGSDPRRRRVNPKTKQQVVRPMVCHYTLAVMPTAGLYETSGDWLYEIGLPGKSGIGGGIVTVSPGKGGLGTFSAPLDAAGNSVRGELVTQFLSQRLGLDLLTSSG